MLHFQKHTFLDNFEEGRDRAMERKKGTHMIGES